MSELDELVKKRTHELNHLLEGLGTDFPVVEDNKRRRIAYLEMLIEDLSSLKTFKPTLNDNQQTLLLWMKETECETDDPLEPISDLFLEGTPSKYFPDLGLSCVEAAYQSLNKIQKIGLVQEYLRQAQEQEGETE